MKIAIIGTGNLGKSIAKGLIQNNSFTQLFLTKRNIDELHEFKDLPNIFIRSNNEEAIVQSKVLIFAVQPAHFEKVLKETAPLLSNNHIVISTVTGFSIEKMESLIGANATIMRAMPNTAIAVGKSMTCICSNIHGKAHQQTAMAIFNQLGTSMVIPESQMQAATVICASGIAFWMRLIRATTQAAIQLGFDAKEAQELAMHTSEGAASLLIATGNHPEEEIDKVTTPKGCTIEGLNEMEHKGLSAALIQGMIASFNKINTIKKEN
ncbi:pyrroline-5-carboxylate reductase [Mangrovimonas yunxiaonensis]|uniref:Pyrroline-5-carboxylate reductase n=1 Tax=Mangrovimonas yunxiaonensis TaxID=1197477 RepID=A0A084TM60_9FLAO|nr:pyrroline-5-carboxylate reductase [Mangrovimonas yunxiaonensis]KFB01796.1 pyrroline-5-carboxylate reductase [Mangrovimonas yunxiaonensis]GGH41023.1 pyrroline-5-carboxylate reductase [Mangrovimonas yunxiaonensis]